MVSRPVMALAYQWRFQPGSILRIRGRTKVNIIAIAAAERMEYATVLMAICRISDFHLLCCWVEGRLIAKWFRILMNLLGRCFSIS